MKRRFCFGVICFLLLIGCYFIFDDKKDYLFKTDYYEAVNQDVLKAHHLSNDEYTWSRFTEAQDKSDDSVDQLIFSIVSGNTYGLDDIVFQNIQTIYSKASDWEKRGDDGIQVLIPYLDMIENSQSILELVDCIVVVENDLGVDILTNVIVGSDYIDNQKNIVYFYPVTLAFDASSDYIVNSDYMTYKAYLKRACIQLWEVYGYSKQDARKIVNQVFSFYEELSNHSKLASDLEDIRLYYQVISKDDFLNLYFNILIEEYLMKRGIFDVNYYSIVDLSQYQYLNESLTEDNLDVWKKVIETKILSSYAIYGSFEYANIVTNLNDSLLGVAKENMDSSQNLDIVEELFSKEIDFIYEREVLDQNKEEILREMFYQIKSYYGKMLEENDWLEQNTIVKAKQKLDKMDVVIGLSDDYETLLGDVKLLSFQDSLIEDVIYFRQLQRDDELSWLRSGKRKIGVSQSLVNAYYQPLTNSIIIPASFVYLMEDGNDYYEQLGSIGMILAHEMTHAFDGNGAWFDEFGNLSSWWSDKDLYEFEKLKKRVSEYYSKYEVIDGEYINGEKTVNENIADLGALSCIVGIARDRGANDEEMRKMFSSFARLWVSQESDFYMELLLLQDVHAPNKYRVNAVLSSIDDFYKVYHVHAWDEMSISKSDRVRVW